MARASSVISVAITGDSKKLQGALKGADKGVAGFGKSMKSAALGIGAALAGVFAVSKAFDFLGDSLEVADAHADAVSNLNRIIGKVNTGKLEKAAGSFLDIGLATADVLELSVGFARIARTIGISPHIIGRYADDVAEVAQALSLVDENGRGAAEWVTIIGKVAAKPSLKNAKDLGISLTKIEDLTTKIAVKETGKLPKNLSDADKAAARLKAILILLGPVVDDVLANPDAELNRKRLAARIKELQDQIGTGLQPIVADILQDIVNISKSEWVDDLVKGIEVLQGKHTVQIFEDFKLGVKTASAVWDVAVAEWSSDIKELQDAFTVQLPAGIQVAADALGPLTRAIEDISKLAGDAADAMFGLQQAIIDMAAKVASPLASLLDILRQIIDGVTHLDSSPRFTTVTPGTRTPRNSPGSGTTSDRFVSDAVRRQRERNGLGGN